MTLVSPRKERFDFGLEIFLGLFSRTFKNQLTLVVKFHNCVWKEFSHDAPVVLGMHNGMWWVLRATRERQPWSSSTWRSMGCGTLPRHDVRQDYG